MVITKNLIPENEQLRLQALHGYNILDTFPEGKFDDITKLISQICEVPIAYISLIDANRQWFKSRVGLRFEELPRDISFSQYTLLGQDIFEVCDTHESEIFRENQLVLNSPYIRFYAGMPLTTPEGYNIGALVVVDDVPKKLTEVQRLALNTLAKHVITHLELRKKNSELLDEVYALSETAIENVTNELNSYKIALDETAGVIISDKNGLITFVNEETCRASKFSREELIGKDSTIFDSGFHPDEFFANLWETITKGEIWKGKINNQAKDGTYYWTETIVVPFLDKNNEPLKFISIKKDITKQIFEENRLDKFFDLSIDYFCLANTRGYFEKISSVFSKELGFSNEELLSRPFFDFIHEEDLEKTQLEIQNLGLGIPTINFETRFKCKDGSYKLLSWHASADKESGMLYATARDISLMRAIDEENKRLSLVAKKTDNIVIITDKYRKVEWVNKACETKTGYTLEEFIGTSPGKLVQYEDTDPQTINKIRECLEQNVPFKGEIKNRSKSGNKYWLELGISPVFNEEGEVKNFISIGSDITEKKEKILQINTLMETQIAIFNGVSHAVMFTSMSGKIIRTNKACLDLLGYTEEEVINNMNLTDFHLQSEITKRADDLSKELNKEISADFMALAAKTCEKEGAEANEWTYLTKEGKQIPVWVSITCIKNTKGEPIGFFSAAEDYTQKKQAELDLLNAKNMAVQAAEVKDSFLANMSHEIRTPLNAIIGFTELLTQLDLPTTIYEYVDHIHVAGDNLLNIINDILDTSKIESGQLVIESQPFSLKVTLKHVYDLLKNKTTNKKLDFNLLLDANMPEYVMGDKGRLNQIMMNLAGNSLKFTEEGEVTISVKKVEETEDTVSLRFSVKDTGIGIPEDKQVAIFERFRQAEESTTRKFGGTGLGLNIVKQLIELQKGEIHVKSKLGEGSEFFFLLTFPKVKSEVVARQTESFKPSKPSRSLSVLLCEDNRMNQLLAAKVIENFGFELDIANNGQEGIDLLAKKKYDLVLMDLQMPVKDGYQTTIYIRQELKMDIPIIAMTAHSLVGEQTKCFDLGMNAYVAKPFKQKELIDKIKEVCNLT